VKKLIIATIVALSATSALANSQLQTLFSNAEGYFNNLNGYVVEDSSNGVIIDIGTKLKATPGLIVSVYEENEPIVHPITGKTLGTKQVLLGQLEIVSVFEEYSTASKKGQFAVKPGNTVHIEKPVKVSLKTELTGSELETLRSLIAASSIFTEAGNGYEMHINKSGTTYSCEIRQAALVLYYDTIAETAAVAKSILALEAGTSLPKGKYLSMAVGKVFRDRGPVIVAAQEDVLHFFTLDSFEKIAELEGKFSNVASVELADMDKDGIDEVFVSNITRETYAYSFVYEHDGKDFVMLQGELDFMLRSYKQADGTRALFGQQLNSPEGGYRGEIFYVSYANGKYTKGAGLPGTVGKQLFGFTMIPVEPGLGGESNNLMISIDPQGRLAISTFKSNIYSSQDFFGDTFHRFKPTNTDIEKSDLSKNVTVTVRPRVEALDASRYIIVQNNMYTRVFSNTPVFDISSIGVYSYTHSVFTKTFSIDEQTPVVVDIYTYEEGGKPYLLTLTSTNKWIGGDPSSIARYSINLD
jgi:hypothetical protein